MIRNKLLFFILLLFVTACFQGRQEVPEPTENPNVFKTDHFPATGKVINMDTVANPNL